MPVVLRPLRLLAALLGLASLTLIAGGCVTAAKPPLRIELWGDSISAQAAPNISFFLGLSGKATSRVHTFGGTALCDWFPDMRSELNPSNPAGFHPQAVIIQFSGDAFTPCMRDRAGFPYSGQGLVNKYAADSAAAIAMFSAAHVPVYFVSTPLSRTQSLVYTGLTPLDVMFSQLPARFPAGRLVRYIDGANPLEWHGKFSFTLPCLSWETCTGRWPDLTRTVVVRQADGVHFCPVAEVMQSNGFRTCPVPMPGATRFALAISGPVSRDFHL
jgi:hypothetical protein